MKADLVIVANSPGELSALVEPVVAAALAEFRITLVLTPCQYTSGRELDYVRTIKGIIQLVTANEYKNWILRNQKPKIDLGQQGVVLYLGGDLAHAMLVAKKVGFPAFAYVQDFLGWHGSYRRFFVPDEQSRAKLDPKGKFGSKMKIVGNLIVDSVASLPKWAPEENVITFLPGSRSWQINHTTPIYEKIIAELRSRQSPVTCQIVSSPFEPAKPIAGAKMINLEEAYNSELVVTIPGTNTARLAAMGIPMIVIFPLDNLDVIPLEGIAHYICSIPYFGSKIKRYFADIMNAKTSYFALPNIKANKEIVPEIRGIIEPRSVAESVIALLNDRAKRNRMSDELLKAMGGSGAAKKILSSLG